MSDYSTASTNAASGLDNAADGGMVEEYTISTNSRTVKKGKSVDQIKGAVMLEGLANRRSAGTHRVAKFRGPR